MKRLISITLTLLLLISCVTIAANAETLSFSLRIEGIEKSFYNADVDIQSEEKMDYTIAQALSDLVKDGSLQVEGIENNYITSINGDKNGTFGGYDGWQYLVNGETPSVGVGDYKINNGDSILFYYGDLSCQIPVLDSSKANEGILNVKSYDTVWSDDGTGNWTSSSAWNPVVGAKLFIGKDEYTTDESGTVNLGSNIYSGVFSVQIEKKGESGVPLVCRFADNFTVAIDNSASATEPATDATTETQPVTEPATVTVKVPKNQTLYVAQTFSIKAVKFNSTDKISYISNRKSVATVNKNGKVTAVKKGEAVITVKIVTENKETYKGTFKVKVKNPKLNQKTVSLKKGGTFTIKITGKAGTQTYSTSDKKVAKVSKKGKITAKKKGKATITVKTNKNVKLKVKVTVK